MSAVVIVRLKADPQKVQEVLRAHAAEIDQVTADAQAAGALSHRFVSADGEVLIIDEWNDAQSFQTFFGTNKTIATVMQEAGVTERPNIEVFQPLEAPGTL
jgi:quinol monooxygenase YgiN